MSARMFCNVVFAWLMRDLDAEQREQVIGKIYAPADGAGADLTSRLLTNITAITTREG